MGSGYGFDKQPTIRQIVDDYNLLDDGTVHGAIGAIWDAFADKDAVYPRLREWYVRRTVLVNITGGEWRSFVDWEQAGVSEKNSGSGSNLQSLLTFAQAEITRLEGQAVASRGAVSGVMTAGLGQSLECRIPRPLGWPWRGRW